jgi:hypothetical protein
MQWVELVLMRSEHSAIFLKAALARRSWSGSGMKNRAARSLRLVATISADLNCAIHRFKSSDDSFENDFTLRLIPNSQSILVHASDGSEIHFNDRAFRAFDVFYVRPVSHLNKVTVRVRNLLRGKLPEHFSILL